MMLQRFTRTRTGWIVPLILGGSLTYAQFTTGVSLVEVYATVTDRQGVPVTDLEANDFRVMQDGVPQTITVFAAGEFPLAVAIGVDRSFSMAGRGDRLAVAKSAARAFIGALRKDDQVMVVAIGSDTEVAAPLSTDHAAELVGQARRRDVLVYPIALGEVRPPVFAELATATGGRSSYAKDPRELAGILTTIARELRFQYLLGYVPPASPGSSWHAIDVNVDRRDVRVRAGDRYFSRQITVTARTRRTGVRVHRGGELAQRSATPGRLRMFSAIAT